MELDLQLFGGRGGGSGVATAGGSMQDTYGQMAEAKTEQAAQTQSEATKATEPNAPSYAETAAERNAATLQKTRDYAESIRGSQESQGAYFNSNGDLVHREKDGAKGLREARQQNPSGLHYVVNRQSSGFEPGDLEEFGEFKHRSMTAVTPKSATNPNGRTYTLTRTSKASPENVEKFSEGASKTYNDRYVSARNSGMNDGMAAVMAKNEMRRWIRQNAGRYHIQYTEE